MFISKNYCELRELRLVDSAECRKLIKLKNWHRPLKIKNIIELKSIFKATREDYSY